MRLADRPHWVYRCYDADENLLYVGMTCDLERRMKELLFWPSSPAAVPNGVLRARMASFSSERHPTRASALAAEAAAIRTEHPELNVNHNRQEVISA